MTWFSHLRAAAASVFNRQRLDRDLDEEMRFHIESETRRLVSRGLSPEDARRQATRDFGSIDRYKEETQDAQGARVVTDLGQDLRFAMRTLIRRKGFTVVAVLTLAIGIGATTALFGVVKAVLIAPLPYRAPENIAEVWSAWKDYDQTWLSYDEYEAYQTEIPAFESVALFSDGFINLTEGDEPERLRTGNISANLFHVLGVDPIIGRGFTREEDIPNGPNVIVLGYNLWKRRFNADSTIVGRTVQVGGRATTVVGVMPEGFRLPLDFGGNGPTEAWQPVGTDAASEGATPGPAFSKNGGNHGYYAVARLRNGATIAQANGELRTLIARAVAEGAYPPSMAFRAFAVSVRDQVTGRVKPLLLVAFGAVAFVLFIACANVAGLMLVRGEARRRELALRVALGASAQRLTRQLLSESFVVAGAGGVVGVSIAWLFVFLIRIAAPADLPRFSETRLDPLVLVFAAAVSMCAAVLAGVLPATQARRTDPASELKEGGRSATTGTAGLRWRQALVASEIALAVVLVTGAGLMIRSVTSLLAIDSGLDTKNVLTMRLATPAAFYPDSIKVVQFHNELVRRVSELSGVRSAGTVRILPLASEMGDWGLRVEGYTPPENQGTPADWQVVTPGYFETMGLKLLAGRFLDQRDGFDAPQSMVVNRRFVELYSGGRDIIGRKVLIGGPDAKPYTIVGVVGNVHHNGLTKAVKAQFYAPLAQFARTPGNTTRNASLVIKTTVPPLSLVAPVRAIIHDLDARLPVSQIRTMDDVVASSIAQPRFAMGLLSLFSVVALVLASVGIFGIVAQIAAARMHEFGIRAALGASPRELVALSIRGGLTQTFVGLAVGVLAALGLTRLMSGLLHGVTPTDLPTFAAVVGVTGVVAMLATIGPARRAARVDPLSVLHED